MGEYEVDLHEVHRRVVILEHEVQQIKTLEPRLSHIERLLLQVRAVVIVLVVIVVFIKFGFVEALRILL